MSCVFDALRRELFDRTRKQSIRPVREAGVSHLLIPQLGSQGFHKHIGACCCRQSQGLHLLKSAETFVIRGSFVAHYLGVPAYLGRVYKEGGIRKDDIASL